MRSDLQMHFLFIYSDHQNASQIAATAWIRTRLNFEELEEHMSVTSVNAADAESRERAQKIRISLCFDAYRCRSFNISIALRF